MSKFMACFKPSGKKNSSSSSVADYCFFKTSCSLKSFCGRLFKKKAETSVLKKPAIDTPVVESLQCAALLAKYNNLIVAKEAATAKLAEAQRANERYRLPATWEELRRWSVATDDFESCSDISC